MQACKLAKHVKGKKKGKMGEKSLIENKVALAELHLLVLNNVRLQSDAQTNKLLDLDGSSCELFLLHRL